MENLDIYILTTIVSTLFVVFIVLIYREIKTIDENSYKHEKEGGPRVALFNLMARLFEDETIPKKERKKVYKAMYRTVADMESEGIYFPENVKKELKKYREELQCEYSGLPSVKAYSKEQSK